MEPNDVTALTAQGEAMVAKGAVQRAKENLAKLRTLCGKAECRDANALAAVIAKGPPIATASADTVAPKPATSKE